jgi:hypothetical protein
MKSLITTGVLATALALSGAAAMAATGHVHKAAKSAHVTKSAHVAHTRAAKHVTAQRRQPGNLNADIAQFIQSMLSGGPVQYQNLVRDARRASVTRGASGSSYSPSYDYSTAAPASCASCDSQAAADQEVQEIQQMNDTNAATASAAAAEEQNDAANAATLQTEINAGT